MVKKRIILLLMLTVLMLTSIMPAHAVTYFYDGAYHEYEGNIFNLKVNGIKLNPEMPPIVFSDYSVVPARSVFQDGLGATVEWDGSTREVTVTMGKTELILTIDKTTALLNGKKVEMPIAPKIINDYTMIPARFVGEKLGMHVDFDSKTDTVIIERKDAVKITGVTYEKESKREGLLTIQTDTLFPEFDDFVLQEPTRLVIDIPDGQFDPMQDTISVGTGNLEKIRFGQQLESARIVIDLTEDLGYMAAKDGEDILVYITIDPTAKAEPKDPEEQEDKEPEESEKPGTISPSPTPAGPIRDIFKVLSYGAEGGQDYIKLSIEAGTPEKEGNKVTVPIYGDLPAKAVSKAVTCFFMKEIAYTPILEGEEGLITLILKDEDAELYERSGEIRLKSTHKMLPRSVTIDAGHGGQDPGAVAENEDGTIKAKEKDFNLDIALKVEELLLAEGIDVHMIRTEDVYVDYLRVGAISNDAGTSLFVSIHTNSAIVPTASGIETLGYLNAGNVSNGMTSQRLSEIILDNVIEETEAHRRGVKDGKTLAVINSTKMPATLLEIGFISNTEECEKLMDEKYRAKIAEGIFNGILEAFDEMGI